MILIVSHERIYDCDTFQISHCFVAFNDTSVYEHSLNF